MKRILLLIGVVIIILIYIFRSKEGFNSTFSDYKNIDRIKTNEGFRYCLGGNINCKIGNAIHISDSYSGGSTYKNLCSDDFTQPRCENNLTTNMSMEELSSFNVNFVPFPFLQSGFTIDYNDGSTPFIMDGSDNINFYNFDYYGTSAGSIHKCNLLNAQDKELCKKISITSVLNTIRNAEISTEAYAKSALLSELDSSNSVAITKSQAELARLSDIDSSHNAQLTNQYVIDISKNMYTSGVNAQNAINSANTATRIASESKTISDGVSSSLENARNQTALATSSAASSLINSMDASRNALLAADYYKSASNTASSVLGSMIDSSNNVTSATSSKNLARGFSFSAMGFASDSKKSAETSEDSAKLAKSICPSNQIWDTQYNICHVPCIPGQTWDNTPSILRCK